MTVLVPFCATPCHHLGCCCCCCCGGCECCSSPGCCCPRSKIRYLQKAYQTGFLRLSSDPAHDAYYHLPRDVLKQICPVCHSRHEQGLDRFFFVCPSKVLYLRPTIVSPFARCRSDASIFVTSDPLYWKLSGFSWKS